MTYSESPRVRSKILVLGMGGPFGRIVARLLVEDPQSRYEVIPVTTTRRPRTFRVRGVGEVRGYESVELMSDFGSLTGLSEDDPALFVVDCSKEVQWQVASRFAEALSLPLLMLNTIGINQPENERALDNMSALGGADFLLLRCPNALKPFVALFRALESIADATPGAFTGLKVFGSETHQAQKGMEIAGTLKRFVTAMKNAGAEIVSVKNERDPERQVRIWHVPIRFLGGHAYHLIVVKGSDFGFSIRTWVHGRAAYARYIRDDVLPRLISLKQSGESGIHMH